MPAFHPRTPWRIAASPPCLGKARHPLPGVPGQVTNHLARCSLLPSLSTGPTIPSHAWSKRILNSLSFCSTSNSSLSTLYFNASFRWRTIFALNVAPAPSGRPFAPAMLVPPLLPPFPFAPVFPLRPSGSAPPEK